MVFTPVEWANNDIVTETKLDQMIANDQHLRVETDVRAVVTSGPVDLWGAVGSGTTPLTLKVDSDTVWLVVEGSSQSAPNYYIGDLAVGIHIIEFAGCAKWRFYRTPDMNYLHFYAERREASNWFYSLTALASREPL